MSGAGQQFQIITITCQNTERELICGILLHEMQVKFNIGPDEDGYVSSQLNKYWIIKTDAAHVRAYLRLVAVSWLIAISNKPL
jgi:hypothetical protein